ncbi:MAG: hypothetical protein V7631_2857 [Massilia sp.]|jgi:hypothetical protein
MKTQLLEDIGQSAGPSLTPSHIAGNSTAEQAVRKPAPAAKPAPASEPVISTTQQPDPQAAHPELDSVFEEIAALEAQYVHPGPQHAPAIAPVDPEQTLPAPQAAPLRDSQRDPLHDPLREPWHDSLHAPLHKPAIRPAEPTLDPDATQGATTPQDPLFDFTPPAPALQAADPFTRAPTGLTRSRRYLLWGACALSGALLVLGGRWLYQERNDAGSLAFIANQAKQGALADRAVQRPAIAAQASRPGADSDVRLSPTAPANAPSPAVPPLVMLAPDPSAPVRPEQPSPSAAVPAPPRTTPEPEPVAEQAPAAPLPKPATRTVRERSDAAAEPARKRSEREREPVRQLARASAIGTEKPAELDTSLAATLKACRAYGYHATECVKRACSVTRYGLVCRGR